MSSKVNDSMVALVHGLSETGPEIGELSRRLGVFKETVRYRFNNFILGNNMSVHAAVDFGKLGLSRAVAVVNISYDIPDRPRDFLMKFAEKNFVAGIEKLLTKNLWAVSLYYPKGQFEKLAVGFKEMSEIGIIGSYKLYNLERFHVVPMNPEHFDFVNNRWDYDWSTARSVDIGGMQSSETETFDQLDLKIIEQLQGNANMHLVDMALPGVNYKTISYHYRTHILERKLVPGYWINWLGTRWRELDNAPASRPHTFLRVDVWAHGVSESEISVLGRLARSTPFLWSEAAGPDWSAKFAYPVENTPEALRFLDRLLESVHGKAEMAFMDQKTAVSYSIAPSLYSDETKSWLFNPARAVEELRTYLVEAKVARKI